MAKKKEGNFAPLEHLKISGDSLSFFSLLFSVFLLGSIVLLFFLGLDSGVGRLLEALKTYAFPWLIVILLLSIGLEFWAIKVHLKHIHLGTLLEKYIGEG
ncbi:MAG: hypothetical protein V1820_03160 [archaeon]